MSEWWTYRPSDFLMFSPRAYWRLFELANEPSWPLQLVLIAVGLGWWIRRWRPTDVDNAPSPAARLGAAYLAVAWAWVAWVFLQQRYAAINWAAGWFAMAFVVQASAFAALAVFGRLRLVPRGRRRLAGLALTAWALLGQPLLGAALGRPWTQLEVIGVAPDPTMIAALGYLTMVRSEDRAAALWRCLWIVPLLGCAVSAVTLWTIGSAQACVLPLAVAVATWAVWQPDWRPDQRLDSRPDPPADRQS
jgi:hypothetical protein